MNGERIDFRSSCNVRCKDCKSEGYKEYNWTTGMRQENLEMIEEIDCGVGIVD